MPVVLKAEGRVLLEVAIIFEDWDFFIFRNIED
jgi:hypothetical protein